MIHYNDGRFPGGPSTPQVVQDRTQHKCERLWMGNVDYPRKSTRYHGQSQVKMMTEGEHNSARRTRLSEIGFGSVTSFKWMYTDVALCFAIAERFWPKTCTFHFPIGEMGITLEDVFHITGLPISGTPLVHEEIVDYTDLIEGCLGQLPPGPDGVEACFKGRIKLKWLRDKFGKLPAHANSTEVDRYTRAYLLAMCGNCFFPNSSGSYVSATWLRFLDDLDNVNKYAWGVAILSFLFKSIADFAQTPDATDLRGFIPLLQVWSYEHFPSIGRPIVAPDAITVPLLSKYCTGNRTYSQDPHHSVPIFRQEFDLLTADQVIWTPYPSLGAEFESLYAHRSCLIALKTIFPHPVDRCMRQLGFVQDVPGDPIVWTTSSSGIASSGELLTAIDAWKDRFKPQFQVRGQRLGDGVVGGATTQRYMIWYGSPRMYNSGVIYDEPRYTPRGYGDRAANVLWRRCNDVADELDTLCDQLASDLGPLIQNLRAIAERLRSPVPGGQWPLLQEQVTAPVRVIPQGHQVVTTSLEQVPHYPSFVKKEDGGI